MQTIVRSAGLSAFAVTMLLGLAMTVGIHLAGEPGLAWLGFAMAAIGRAAPSSRCLGGDARTPAR
jgi:hypothetical protein